MATDLQGLLVFLVRIRSWLLYRILKMLIVTVFLDAALFLRRDKLTRFFLGHFGGHRSLCFREPGLGCRLRGAGGGTRVLPSYVSLVRRDL